MSGVRFAPPGWCGFVKLTERKRTYPGCAASRTRPSSNRWRRFQTARPSSTIAANSGSRASFPSAGPSGYSSGQSRHWVQVKCRDWKRGNAERHKLFGGPRQRELTEAQKTLAKKRQELGQVRRAHLFEPGTVGAAAAPDEGNEHAGIHQTRLRFGSGPLVAALDLQLRLSVSLSAFVSSAAAPAWWVSRGRCRRILGKAFCGMEAGLVLRPYRSHSGIHVGLAFASSGSALMTLAP